MYSFFSKVGLMLSLILTLTTLTSTLCAAQCTTPSCSHCTAEAFRCSGLDSLPPSDEVQSTVSEISVTGGTIADIPAAYFNFPQLATLNLSRNSLTTLHSNIFENANFVETIDLTGNNIVCDGNIDWLNLWQSTNPFNAVIGDCDSGPFNTISEYLADKPRASDVIFEGKTLEYGRNCWDNISVQVTISPPLGVDVTYVVSVDPLNQARETDLTLVTNEVLVPAQGTSMNVILTVSDGGQSGDVKEYLIRVSPKSPVSFSADSKIFLVDGDACELLRSTPAPAGGTTGSSTTTPASATTPNRARPSTTPPKTTGSSASATTPAPSHPTSHPTTAEPTRSSAIPPEPKGSSDACVDETCRQLPCPEDLQYSSNGCCPKCPTDCELSGTCHSTNLAVVFVIIIGGIVIVAGGGGGYYVYKRHKTDKEVAAATTDSLKVTYSPVGPEAKVYNDTTEDL